MQELWNSLSQYLFRRAKSQLYGVFAVWWVVFHWGFFYSLFFLDQNLILDKTMMLKNEYLKTTYFDIGSLEFWLYFIAPFLATYLTIWWFPKIVILAYRKEKDDDYDRQIVKINHDKKVEGLKTQLEEKRIEKLDKAEQRVEKEKRVEGLETATWLKEYDEFKKSKYFADFSEIVDSVYQHQGKLRTLWNGDGNYYEFEVPTPVLTYAHSNDIVQLDGNGQNITLTDKGKFFVRQYASDKDVYL